MKEKIYTIPVNEAFSKDCECPLCEMVKTLEVEAIKYAVGPAMMEPDYRILSNEKGYCNKHYSMLFSEPNKLSLSLVLETHLESTKKMIEDMEKDFDSLLKNKSIFKKDNNDEKQKILNTLKKHECDCVVCEKINDTFERYIDVLFYLWKNDDEFIKKFENSKGFCLPHFQKLIEYSTKYLSKKEAYDFVIRLYKKQISELSRIEEDIHRFILKFDYRNSEMPWENAKDAPKRTIEKLSGYILELKDKNKE